MKHKYNKPPLTIDQQIERLKSRGMEIDEKGETIARHYLTTIGYYKLSGYWFAFQNKYFDKKSILPESFHENISFNDIKNIYIFDEKLRSLFMEALCRCEIAIKAAFNNYTTLKFEEGAFWYLEEKYFSDWIVKRKIYDKATKKRSAKTEEVKCTYQEWREKLSIDLNNIHTCQFKNAYQKKYGDDDLPFWMVLELETFGSLEKMYNLMNNAFHKRKIAEILSVSTDQLENALAVMRLTRNKCAHYDRLYNFVNSIIPTDINNKKFNPEFNYAFSTKNEDPALLFPIYYMLTYFLHNISGKSTWANRVKNLIDCYTEICPYISYEKMGFPVDWESLPLFKKMLGSPKI